MLSYGSIISEQRKKLNDNTRRYKKERSNGEDLLMKVNIDWLVDSFEVLERSSGTAMLDYSEVVLATYRPKRKIKSNLALVEVKFDGFLMYKNIIKINEYEIV